LKFQKPAALTFKTVNVLNGKVILFLD